MIFGWTMCLVVCLLASAVTVSAEPASEPQTGGEALIIEVEGAIGPATSAYVEEAITDAEARGAELLVLKMDTPGGLDTSMRAIVKAINASQVPVVGFVAPSGARAASASSSPPSAPRATIRRSKPAPRTRARRPNSASPCARSRPRSARRLTFRAACWCRA